MKLETQREGILCHLKKYKSITPMEALDLFGSFRLADQIFKLKKAGHLIKTELVHLSDGRRYAKYKYLGVAK